MEAILGITYRCNAKCYMCNTWQYPTKISEELPVEFYEKIPSTVFTNITGGEPFLREDIEEIIKIVRPKTKRLVISTNGFFTDRIINLAKKGYNIGFRISIEGLPKANDELRGIKDGFDRGFRTLLELYHMGIKDIGFGITVSDRNAKDLLELYKLANAMKIEFATAATHNTYYFHKFDNKFDNTEMISAEFEKLIAELLKTNRIKNWFRAYFNYGLINYIKGGQRLLPCKMGTDVFYLDPFGDIRPCNAMDEVMGNIRENTFDDIWTGNEAEEIRKKVCTCDKRCWMIGSASPAMKKSIWVPILWILKNRNKYKDLI